MARYQAPMDKYLRLSARVLWLGIRTNPLALNVAQAVLRRAQVAPWSYTHSIYTCRNLDEGVVAKHCWVFGFYSLGCESAVVKVSVHCYGSVRSAAPAWLAAGSYLLRAAMSFYRKKRAQKACCPAKNEQ